ncbi:flagellar basal body P-ring formation chaperone FlgA [Deferribacterales bacterium Es71-Z0220]|uniref:flagellar basal body P-ring formation chaperone FlgA n=1 Tax=Deferrivibrio essentukiensis TaxID=2880922 RepID=UPI001F602E1B|nr:flagellar basal body P-ring formation chaperone FlgA [Deferrivibrio essentukiensis]MCB4203372.1 flagellar basal body P-ring formation chaperone FlgA [Deferrivibrio essentukiensis]
MVRLILIVLLTYSLSFAGTLTVDTDCVYLDEIDKMFEHKPAYCGLEYNESVNIYLTKIAQLTNYDIKLLRQKFPEKIVVTRKGVPIEEKEIFQKLISELNRFEGLKFKVKKINYNKTIFASAKGEFQVRVKEIPFGSTDVYINNGQREYRIYAYVETYKKGFVATSKIDKGAEFKNNYTEQLVNITNIRDMLADDLDEKLAKSTIYTGKPILEKNTYRKPDIFKGEKVKILFRDKFIAVATVGEVLENSYIGEKLQVKNLDSGKILTAVYKGEKTALVVF